MNQAFTSTEKRPENLLTEAMQKTSPEPLKLKQQRGAVVATLTIAVEYGVNITALCNSVQEKVKQAVQTMTNLTVARVDISVQELLFRKDKGEQKK